MVPHFLARFGMELRWARKVGAVQHLFNGVILLVTVVFHASVTDQQWAYATSVLVLLTSASVAALLDAGRPLARPARSARWSLAPFAAVTFFFLAMIGGLFARLQLSGFAIALGFVVVLLATAFTSRWLRSTEPRFEGFAFADEATKNGGKRSVNWIFRCSCRTGRGRSRCWRRKTTCVASTALGRTCRSSSLRRSSAIRAISPTSR